MSVPSIVELNNYLPLHDGGAGGGNRRKQEEKTVRMIPDDPIIHRMELTGFPPWMDDEGEDEETGGGDLFAVYDP